jgi:hypothetical protein
MYRYITSNYMIYWKTLQLPGPENALSSNSKKIPEAKFLSLA